MGCAWVAALVCQIPGALFPCAFKMRVPSPSQAMIQWLAHPDRKNLGRRKRRLGPWILHLPPLVEHFFVDATAFDLWEKGPSKFGAHIICMDVWLLRLCRHLPTAMAARSLAGAASGCGSF